jgi:hypothetical protein
MIFPYKRNDIYQLKATQMEKEFGGKWGKYEVNLFGR